MNEVAGEGVKKILHVQKVSGIAGSEKHLLTLLPRLDRQRFRVTLLMLVERVETVEGYASLLRKLGVGVRMLRLRGDFDPLCLLQMCRYMRGEGFDLVHTHLIHGDVYGVVAARLAGIPHIVSSRHNDDAFRRHVAVKALLRLAMRRCDRVIAISRHLSEFVQGVENVPRSKVSTIHYGLVPATAGPVESKRIREEFGVPDGTPLAVSVGRLTGQKGHRYLLEAWQILAAAGTRARLLIAGDGPLRGQLGRYADELGLTGAVTLTGWRSDVPAFLEAADVYVHPSLWEGFGLVLLEAMAAGKSVIASRVSAIPEIVLGGETGLLVPPGDPAALAGALARLFVDRPARVAMGEAGRRRVLSEFTAEKMAAATEELYATVLAGPARTRRG